jgi:hypothetical protein
MSSLPRGPPVRSVGPSELMWTDFERSERGPFWRADGMAGATAEPESRELNLTCGSACGTTDNPRGSGRFVGQGGG